MRKIDRSPASSDYGFPVGQTFEHTITRFSRILEICPRIEYSANICVFRLPSGMTYEPPTAWNWSGPTDNTCSYYPPQTDPFSFYSTPQPRLPFFPDMGISPYSSANELDYSGANGRLNFLGSQSASHCGNGAMPVKDEAPLENSNDRFVLLPVGCIPIWITWLVGLG